MPETIVDPEVAWPKGRIVLTSELILPPKGRPISEWASIFKTIPKGKALVLEGEEGMKALSRVRAYTKKGSLKRYKGVKRGNTIFIMHLTK